MKTRPDALAPVIDRDAADVALLARVSGLLYFCGGLMVLISLALPLPNSTVPAPLYGIASASMLSGAAFYFFSSRVHAWMIHGCLATASALISLSIYLSGVAAGVYSVMFVWVVIVAACISTRPHLVLHTAWLLFTYGIALVGLEDASGDFSPVTRFVLMGFALSVAGGAVSWLVESRRNAEAGLHLEIENRQELQRELEHLANHDPLTGVANRRRLEEHLPEVLGEAALNHKPLCLIALDLDGFKEYNDKNGHAAGDRLLKSAASAWNAALRDGDLITRMGGDEFLIVLPDCPLAVSTRIAARLRDIVPDGQRCSTGISCWNGKDTADELLAAADKALYATKGAHDEASAA